MTGDAGVHVPPRAGGPVVAAIRPPGSKSLTNRLYVLAALCRGDGVVRRPLESDDTDALLTSLQTMGIIVRPEGDVVRIDGGDGRFPSGGSVDVGAGGTPARFLLAAATRARAAVEIDGTERMRVRPMADGIELLRTLGAEVVSVDVPDHLPLRVMPLDRPASSRLRVGSTASSQFVSALLLVAPCWPEGLEIEFTTGPTSAAYLDLTIHALRQVGVDVAVERDGHGTLQSIRVPPGGIRSFDLSVESDASSAVYPAVLAAAIPGSRVEIEGLGIGSVQPDVAAIRSLERFGASVSVAEEAIVVESDGPPRGCDLDCAAFPDAAVGLAALAAVSEGTTRLRGLETLRVKECDRVHALATELRRIGCEVSEEASTLTVEGRRPLVVPGGGVDIATYDDHRMAMSFAVVGAVGGGVRIEDPGCVAKSYPGFWSAWETLLDSPR